MKKVLPFLLLTLPLVAHAQERVSTLADLRTRRGTGNAWMIVQSGMVTGDAMGGVFLWNDALTTADDNTKVIRPTGAAGGWEKSEPVSQKRGTSTFNYTTGQLTYTFTHGLTAAPTNVQYTIRSTTIPGASSWTATATTISITFNALPVFAGTTPFTVCWIAYPY